jgi:hypothetical protein
LKTSVTLRIPLRRRDVILLECNILKLCRYSGVLIIVFFAAALLHHLLIEVVPLLALL